MDEYDYIIWDNYDRVIHRGPWDKNTAEQWMREWKDMTFPNDCFSILRAPKQKWETYE